MNTNQKTGEVANLGSLHDEACRLRPKNTALINGETNEEITYDEFGKKVNEVGHALVNLNIEKGDRVALFFKNTEDYIYVFFGACRIGAVPVPINIEAPYETIKYIIRDCGADILVTGSDIDVYDMAADVAEDVSSIQIFAVTTEQTRSKSDISLPGIVSNPSQELKPVPVSANDPALQPYTSGSTGRPKGVVLTHGGVEWNINKIRQVHFLDCDDRAIISTPLYHKNSMIGAVKPMLNAGGSVVIMSGFDSTNVISSIEKYDVTYIRGVPAMYKMLVDNSEALANHDVSSIDWAVSGSANLPEQLTKNFTDVFDAQMGEAYGLTETGGPITLSPRWGQRKTGSSGLALPGADIQIVDPDTGEEVLSGETGEVTVWSPGNGFYKDKKHNDIAFEERDGKNYLHTGDLAYKDPQGYHYIVGRLDDMMIVGGENVYPAEVENLLLKHESVEDVAVVRVPHSVKSEAPVAFVVVNDDISEKELKEFALKQGPAYAHPRRIFFRSELPLSGPGKIKYDALESEARDRIGGEI